MVLNIIRMFKSITRKATPLLAFTIGLVAFPREYQRNSAPPFVSNQEILSKIESTSEYKLALTDPNATKHTASEAFPHQHRKNYVTTGILSGESYFEIDPVCFVNSNRKEFTSFHHLGSKLILSDGQIHNGIVSTLLDEGLCACGFPSLPVKKGVTGSLSIDFKNQAKPESNVVLKAKVVQVKGRKVVIEGNLSDLDTGEEIASAKCVLVQPKWFKYLAWVNVI